MALVQALERQRNEALNRAAQLEAAVVLLQEQARVLNQERDGLKAEVEQLKTEGN
jgi:hypothetical protein